MSGVVVVGSSVGGVRTAQTLRSEGYDGRITVIGEEAEPPYDKPPLSKDYLLGSSDRTAITLLTELDAAAHEIDLVLGSAATGLDLAGRTVSLASGADVHYDRLVIATGSTARPSPWGQPPGVHALRTRADTDALRSHAAGGGPVVIIGAGFIGAEVAASLRRTDADVTLIDPLPLPMQRGLDQRVGGWFRDLHAQRGVRMELGVGVVAVEGTEGDFTVELSDGRRLPAAVVVVGLGAVPTTGWLEASGVQLRDGVITDEFCRVADAEGVYAIGDVARWYSVADDTHVRLEHWTNAVDQAAFVARQIAGASVTDGYSPVPYVWSDQYDWKLQIVGGQGPRSWLVGGPEDGRAAVLFGTQDGAFTGSITLNWPRALVRCRQAAARGARVPELAEMLEAALDTPVPARAKVVAGEGAHR